MGSELDDLDRELAAFEQENAPRSSKLSGSKVLPIAVALVALVSFAGIVWYAYSQGVRSGSEQAAPVIGPETPAKTQPEDPGGMEIPHQDKLVYNQVENSVDDSRVERILPPPEDPTKPEVKKPEVAAPEAETPALPSITGEGEDAQQEELTTTQKGTDGNPRAPEPKTPETPELPDPDLAAPENPPKDVAKPEANAAPAETAKPKAEPAKTAAINPKSDWRIQISALKSEKDARTEWDRQVKAHKDLLGALTLEIQKVKVQGKGTFYRVRGGPLDSRKAAESLCAKLKKAKVGCIVVNPAKS